MDLSAGAGSGQHGVIGSSDGDAVSVSGEGEPAFVDEVVVEPAQQGQLVEVGELGLLVGHGVVGVGPLHRGATAREGAALVLHRQRSALAGVGAPSAAADAHHLGRAVHGEHGEHVSHGAFS